MHYSTLGSTDLRLSKIALGSMTWGEQNSEADAHAQIDLALAHGVNFIDVAEMYPVPPKAETQGLTETYLGNWLQKTGRRQELVIASKVIGPGMFPYLRGGPRLDRAQVLAACETSLQRLKTDYIDLYQVHWPQRPTNYFGQLGYDHRDSDGGVSIEETLSALGELVQQGKVRHIGISNETPWGTMEYLRLAREKSLPRVQSIQNPYSLLNRSFEVGLAEFAHKERTGLLAYSPLAFGMLSGKYLNGARPEKGRLTLFTRFSRYNGEQGMAATAEYVALAQQHGLDPAQMALAYVNSRSFVTSTLIGATTLEQLQSNLDSINLTLPRAVLKGIEQIHARFTIPCP